MNSAWFKRFGCIYIPVNLMGLLVTTLAIIFLVPVYLAIIRNGHSVSDDLYHMFVYTTSTAFWWKWIAEKTS
ncbi:hypothetical protein [Segetibacter koreensis]|uniref:hypothetical protein n=1 Tax=Segetibacter koreensis TaxID=398037 RepID=UPI000380DAE9|nr:hypothetical protein [Segetibacter koreensis]